MRIAGLARREWVAWIILLFFFFSRGVREGSLLEGEEEGRVVVGKFQVFFQQGARILRIWNYHQKLDSSNLGKYKKCSRSKWKQNRSSIQGRQPGTFVQFIVENLRDRISSSPFVICPNETTLIKSNSKTPVFLFVNADGVFDDPKMWKQNYWTETSEVVFT